MKPGIKPLVTGIVLVFLGIAVVPPLCAVSGIFWMHGDPQEVRFRVPGTATARTETAGRYYLWNDYRTVYEGKFYDRPPKIPDGLEIHIRDANGNALEFVRGGSMSSRMGDTSSNSIGYVDVKSPGELQIEVQGVHEERVFSFAISKIPRILLWVSGGLGVMAILGFGGQGLIVWGVVTLARARQQD